jgi:ribosomal protein L16 Arg81 hydroxylase
MPNIVITITPPSGANLLDGTLRILITEAQISVAYKFSPQAAPLTFTRPFADLDPATKAAGQAFLNALVTNEGVLQAMGF